MNAAAAGALFRQGVALFNDGQFFEAHEAWEKVWKSAQGKQKIFYQGLIQAAAALLHARHGNPRGALALYARARPKLERFPAISLGIDLSLFRGELAHYFCRPPPHGPAPTLRFHAAKFS